MSSFESRLGRFLFAGALLFLLAWAGPALGEPDAALTNEDVVEMLEVGLGESVVIAKVQQASRVDFQLDTDSLVELKERGVTDDVLTAMLERDRAPRGVPQGAGGAPAVGGGGTMIGTPMGPMMMPGANSGPGGVWLEADGEEVPLSGIVGEMSVTNAWVARFTFLNFTGLDSGVRIQDPRPRLFIVTGDNPQGRYYVVSLDRDKDDNVRSVKMGRAGMFSGSLSNTPDPDWTVQFETRDEGRGLWSLQPIKDMKPGEYGLLVRASQELYDFAIE